jgi:hypothetical protein
MRTSKKQEITCSDTRSLHACHEGGFTLWTCRTNEQLQNAVDIIKNNEMPITYFNENPEADFGSRKIFANEYWDNAAISTQIIKIL